jgi:histidinol dehydrogenase
MKRVSGFVEAQRLLSRENYWESFISFSGKGERPSSRESSAWEVVQQIVVEVHSRGDEALYDYSRRLDGVEMNSLEVSREKIAAARDTVDRSLLDALELAARRIRDFHSAVYHAVSGTEQRPFVIAGQMGQQVRPLDSVGLYVPGGTAAYPSTVLMMAIPARVAGVKEIIMASPPSAESGEIPAVALAAAAIAGVDRVFKVGGAQAIAALAFGTISVPRVDKICGPGNIFVTLAKKMVYGVVAIDGLEGPSEAVIVADESANPVLCAADLLAQAEHDPLAMVVLITTSPEMANRVEEEMSRQMVELKRRSIAAQAVDRGMLVVVEKIKEAIDLVNLFAPEHLSLMVKRASSLVGKIHNAGCIFVGENSPIVLGDYIAGPSHVLPTGGSARFASPLGIADFLKVSNVVALDAAAVREVGRAAMVIAEAEGLGGHAQAVSVRVGERR